jgi:hypothetical protein
MVIMHARMNGHACMFVVNARMLRAFIASALLAACAQRPAEQPVAATSAAPVVAAPAKPAPSFKAAIVPYFEHTCAEARGCHGAQPTQSVDLDLRGPGAWAQIVNHASEERYKAVRVKPGDPSASYLVAKLSGALGPREGKTMPIDPITGAPMLPVPVDPDFLRNVLEPWIAAGAPNN